MFVGSSVGVGSLVGADGALVDVDGTSVGTAEDDSTNVGVGTLVAVVVMVKAGALALATGDWTVGSSAAVGGTPQALRTAIRVRNKSILRITTLYNLHEGM